MGSGRNFITSLHTEIMPHSFRPSLGGRFAQQSRVSIDEEVYLMILLCWKLACFMGLGALCMPRSAHQRAV